MDNNVFKDIEEAQFQATEYFWTCNNDRLYMAIGGIISAMKLKIAT
jgi:hypothetical protein